MLGSKPLKLHLDQNFRISKDEGTPLCDPNIYRRLTGRLLYLTISRPDLCFPVQLLSQFMASPSSSHLAAAYKILRYIKSAPGQGILLPFSSPFQLKAFCVLDWVSCPDSHRSTTRIVSFLVILWYLGNPRSKLSFLAFQLKLSTEVLLPHVLSWLGFVISFRILALLINNLLSYFVTISQYFILLPTQFFMRGWSILSSIVT